jgi:transcriptional regulator with XRE-family HTH domain
MQQDTTDIGSRLKSAREERGLTLRDVADSTKLSISALKFIEHNDFDRLPGGLYRRSYLQAFAGAVGLDAAALTREYRARFEPPAPPEAPPAAAAGFMGRLRAHGRLVAATMALAGVAIAGLLVSRPEPAGLDAGPMTAPMKVIKMDAASPIALTGELGQTEEQFAVTTAALENVKAPPLDLRSLPLEISTDR